MLVSPDQRLGLNRSVETLAQRFNGFTLHNDIILPCKNGKKKPFSCTYLAQKRIFSFYNNSAFFSVVIQLAAGVILKAQEHSIKIALSAMMIMELAEALYKVVFVL